ncbi:MAG: DEAD/DEAH box helicase [Rhodospirillales bacterium]
MTSFNDLGLAEPLLRALDREGYSHPTPIQFRSIPALREQRDLVGIAQTGTGKTAAFVLPILERVSTARAAVPSRCASVLILAPTRELVSQINDAIRAYGRFVRFSSTTVIGGASARPQIRALQSGLDILVATPGRLLDHLGSGALRLDRTTTLVLDEADQMLDLGFLPAIRQVLRALPSERQTILFSATMPKQIRSLADDFMRDPVEVAVTPAARPVDLIEQSVLAVSSGEKREVLAKLLAEPDVERAIVFTRTKRGADRVTRHLEGSGLRAAAIHGNKSQNQRERTLAAFKSGRISVLVATDIAARGIDVEGVSHVFNFELPNVPEAYVHRIGRTARAGAAGKAISLMDSSERGLLGDIEKLIGQVLLNDGGSRKAPPAKRKPQGGRPQGANGHARSGARQPRSDQARPPRSDQARPPRDPKRGNSDSDEAGLARLLREPQKPQRRNRRRRPQARNAA